ncbi:hypothetical protein [Alkalibacillus aidingensis]|uniref:hypothetical protein n=1 Tax=Alkalibacillus aidingensis TaxID=2747607 RepID=UPI001660F0CB|nr:hypothetical protein [Alkalibacillus aidingensis]
MFFIVIIAIFIGVSIGLKLLQSKHNLTKDYNLWIFSSLIIVSLISIIIGEFILGRPAFVDYGIIVFLCSLASLIISWVWEERQST